MQKFLFGESKAKELNFVGELAEKVSKAIQPQNKKNSSRKNSGRGNSSSNSHGQNDYSSHSARSPSGNQGSQSFHKKKPYNNNQPFWKAPSQGKPYLGGRTKGTLPDRNPTSSLCKLPTGNMHKENRGKPSIYSFTFPSSLCLHQLRKHSEGREAKVFSPELGTLDIRPVDSQHCKGLQTRVNRESQAVKAAFPSSLESQSACPSNKQDYQPLRQESHSECSSPQETVLQQPFPCGKERGRATSSDKPILTKFFCAPSSFQDGGLEGSCRYSSSSRLYVQDRPQRRILCCSHPPRTPEATLFSVPECNLPVQMPTLRPHISTSGLHKSAEAPGGFCEETGSTDMHLHRRHANPEFLKGGSSERCLSNDPPAGKSGVCCEHGKIYSFPFTGNGIPRCSNQLHTHELFPSREQGFEPSE